jgi:predicted NBD/HSP70 family sugar kinase
VTYGTARVRPAISLSDLQKRILWHLRVYGPTPRSRLADVLGQSNAAITRCSGELVTLGLAHEHAPEPRGGRGRPMLPLGLSGTGAYAAGAVCHPGWMEVMLVDFAGAIVARTTAPFDSADPGEFAAAVDAHLRTFAREQGLTSRRFLGLGVAVPGYVIGKGERRMVIDRLAGWRDVPLTAFFAAAMKTVVWIENDGTAAALAEYYQPHIVRRFGSILVFFLGHGLGGGLIADRDLYRGEFGNAGEIGQLFPDALYRPSAVDLIDTFARHGVVIPNLATFEPAHSAHAAILEPWTDRVAAQLHRAMRAGTAWLDPGAVVISGSLPPSILSDLARKLRSIDHDPRALPQPPIFPSTLASSAVCIGAALMPIHAVTKSTHGPPAELFA